MSNRHDPLRIFHIDMNYVCLREDYLRRWLRTLAGMGYNAVLWELEDKVRWETCPQCVWPEAIGKDTFKGLLDYSRELGLEPIPLLQTIGHAEYVLKQEPYHRFREQPDHHDCYCTSNPEVRAFLRTWIEEYLDLFAGPRYFHLGGDEAYVFGTCPRCAARAEETNRNALYAEHLVDIAAPIVNRGARPGIWCDMVLHYPEHMKEIPRRFVIWDWNYRSCGDNRRRTRIWGRGFLDIDDVTEAHLRVYPELLDSDGLFRDFYTSDALQRMGFDVVLASASRSSGDTVFLPQHPRHARNVAAAARKSVKLNLLGHCVTSWAVRLNLYETQVLSIALGPYAMDRPDESIDDLLADCSRRLFGEHGPALLEASGQLHRQLPFAKNGSTAIQWNRLKDSLPAPRNYLADLLREWKQADRPSWADRHNEAAEALDSIRAGLLKICTAAAYLPAATAATVAVWTKAAWLQYWNAWLTVMILADRAGEIPDSLPRNLKAEFETYLAHAEKPRSAAKNAGLVYDATLEYLENL